MFDVCEKRCDQCLFGENKIVDVKRVAGILSDCSQRDTHFICHKFTAARATGQGVNDQTCCRGFYDTGRSTNLMRIAERLGALRFVPVPVIDRTVAVEPELSTRGTG